MGGDDTFHPIARDVAGYPAVGADVMRPELHGDVLANTLTAHFVATYGVRVGYPWTPAAEIRSNDHARALGLEHRHDATGQ